MSEYSTQNRDFEAAIDADQVERNALLMSISNADFGASDERIVGAIDDTLSRAGNEWEERQRILEEKVGNVLREIQRRSDLMGAAYPFTIQGQSIEHIPSELGIYEFCLVASSVPTKRLKGGPPASVVFEWISRDVLKAHFGTSSKGYRTGWPRVKKHEKRGARAKETFAELNRLTGEFRWAPKPLFPSDPPPRLLKDIGLDLAVWIPAIDKRCSQFVALGQCGCGKYDVSSEKARQLSLGRLGNWLDPFSAGALRCFLLAHHVPNESQLYELSIEGGIVFDRARITMTAHAAGGIMDSAEGINYKNLALAFLGN